jgi:hypothetical protein
MKNILKRLGLVYDPDIMAIEPYTVQDKPRQKKTKKADKGKPDKYIQGVPWKLTEAEDGDIVYDLFTGQDDNKSPDLLPDEREAIKKEGLDVQKAARIKPYFSRGLSAKKAAVQIRERGYGERTLDKYYAVLNSLVPQG